MLFEKVEEANHYFLLPWNTIAGLSDPGQMRSFTWNYGGGSRRAFNSSV